VGVLNSKVVIISGGASGIGAATAQLVAAAGATVIIGDVNGDGARQVADDIGGDAEGHHLDVSQEVSWQAMVETVVSVHGRVDGLVSSAGILSQASLFDTTREEFLRVLSVNQVGSFLGIRAVVPSMIAVGGGSIVNVSSAAGFQGTPRGVAYTSSKFGVRGITKGLMTELAPLRIRVNSVEPGYIDTPMSRPDGAFDASSAGRQPANVPMGRTGRADEVGRMIRFLLSDEASYCTGGDYVVDGGLLSRVAPRQAG
jgi:3alpha(or 20beta)-hydroxysteroid dehydrogenase